MATDLWFVVVQTEERYPRIGSFKKLKKVNSDDAHVLHDTMKEILSKEQFKLWKSLKHGWDIRRTSGDMNISEPECRLQIDNMWNVLLERAKEEL